MLQKYEKHPESTKYITTFFFPHINFFIQKGTIASVFVNFQTLEAHSIYTHLPTSYKEVKKTTRK